MLTKAFPLLLAAAFCAGFVGCKKTVVDTQAEQDKAWREQQTKRAIANYQKIVADYPETEYATKAKERLKALNAPLQAPGTPKPALPGAVAKAAASPKAAAASPTPDKKR